MAFEQFGYRRLAQTARLVRRRRGFPEFEQPFGAEVVLEFEQGRELAPELLAQAVDEAVPFDAEILGDARPFAQLDDDRVGGRERAEATRIGAQGGGHDLGVAAVVLSAGHSETVAEAVHLLRVDGVDLEAALDQRLDHRAVWDFDRGQDLAGLGGATRRHQPGGHLGQPLATMFEALPRPSTPRVSATAIWTWSIWAAFHKGSSRELAKRSAIRFCTDSLPR